MVGIPTKTIKLEGENLALVQGRTVGLVLVKMLSQVSIVIEFPKAADAEKYFQQFKEA